MEVSGLWQQSKSGTCFDLSSTNRLTTGGGLGGIRYGSMIKELTKLGFCASDRRAEIRSVLFSGSL